MTIPKLFTAIDPSLRATGLVNFENGLLSDCHLIRTSSKDLGECLREIVSKTVGANSGVATMKVYCEFPQVYFGGKNKVDANDLLKVAAVAGAMASDPLVSVTYVLPKEWKGTVSKEVCNARVLARLQPGEMEAYEEAAKKYPKSLHHNIIDAIGIGLWAAGRFNPKKIYAGAYDVGEEE